VAPPAPPAPAPAGEAAPADAPPPAEPAPTEETDDEPAPLDAPAAPRSDGGTPEGRTAPLARRARTGRSSIAASARGSERARVPLERARVPAARARIPAARARVPADEPSPPLAVAAAAPAAPASVAAPDVAAPVARTATIDAPVVAPAVAAPEPDPASAPSSPETMADRAIGRSLAQPPLPPPPGLGPTRRRLTVPPPSPPFVEADTPFHWQARLPSAVGRSVTIRVGDGKLDLGGTVVAIEQVRDARFKLQVEAALLRTAASARMTVSLALKDGSTVRVSARNAASSKRAGHIVETLTYLWTLLSDTAGAEERALFVEKIDRGAEVQVGRLRLTAIGIAWKRNPIAVWSTIGDPRRVGLDVVIPTTAGEPIVVPLTADDAYQLPVLIPLLRQRFA